MYRIPSRKWQDMIPPITFAIPPGSCICTDEHKSYGVSDSRMLPYEHYSVNHSAKEFKRDEESPTFGPISAHCNTCEGINSETRGLLRFKSGRELNNLDLNVEEVNYRHSGNSLFDPFKVTH